MPITRRAQPAHVKWTRDGFTPAVAEAIEKNFRTLFVDLGTATDLIDPDRGGTGVTSYTAGDMLYADTSAELTTLAIGSAGNILRVSGGLPDWTTFTIPDTFAQGDILYAQTANILAGLTKDANATRYLSNTGSSNNPAWAQVALTTGVSGVLPIANGGTNNSSFTSDIIPYFDGTRFTNDGTRLTWNTSTQRVVVTTTGGTDTGFRAVNTGGGASDAPVIALVNNTHSSVFFVTTAAHGTIPSAAGIYTNASNGFVFYPDATVAGTIKSTKIGWFTSSPTYRVDYRLGTDHSSSLGQVRLSASSTTEGLFLIGYNESLFHSFTIAHNASFDGTNYIARHTSTNLLHFDTGTISFYANTGTTSGNSFTPALIGRVYPSGTVSFGLSTAESFSDVSSTTIYPGLASATTISKSGASDRPVGLYSKLTASNTSPARSFRGYLIVSNSSGTMASASVYTGSMEVTGSSDITEANFIGGNIIVNNAGATVVTARGLDIGNATITAGAITNQAGIRINALSGATNNTHLLIGQAAVPSGAWAIYNANTGNNHIAGPILLGHTTTWGSGTNFISFADGTVPATPASNTAAIYADDVGGTTELFGINEGSVTSQLTGLAIRKTADETVTSNTIQADDHLTVQLGVGTYYFEFILHATTASANAGIQVQLDGTATISSIRADVQIFDHAGNAHLQIQEITAFNSAVGSNNTGDTSVHIHGAIEVTAAGTFFLEWAQNTTDGANGTTVQENSTLILRKLNA